MFLLYFESRQAPNQGQHTKLLNLFPSVYFTIEPITPISTMYTASLTSNLYVNLNEISPCKIMCLLSKKSFVTALKLRCIRTRANYGERDLD